MSVYGLVHWLLESVGGAVGARLGKKDARLVNRIVIEKGEKY